MDQHHESISLAAGVFLIHQEIMNKLWGIWDQVLKVSKRINERSNISTVFCLCIF